jgi:hypothetical protein
MAFRITRRAQRILRTISTQSSGAKLKPKEPPDIRILDDAYYTSPDGDAVD